MTNTKSLFFGICVSTLLVACGGGGGGAADAVSSTSSISGIAATGAAIASGNITLKCVQGPPISTSTASDGSFTFTLTNGHVTPCMMEITASSLGASSLHGFASDAGRANITPITDLIITRALGSDAALAFSVFSSTNSNQIKTNLLSAKDFIKTQIVGITNSNLSIDPMTGSFKVGDSNDVVLDMLGAALQSAGKSLDDVRTLAKTGSDFTSAVPNVNSLQAMLGTYDSGCIVTKTGSAKYTLNVTNLSGSNTASASLRVQIFKYDPFKPQSLSLADYHLADFSIGENSKWQQYYRNQYQLPYNQCESVTSDITVAGQITNLSSFEFYGGMIVGLPDGNAKQVDFRLDNVTYSAGGFRVTIPTLGASTKIGYRFINNNLYFTSGFFANGYCLDLTKSCRVLNETYLTKQ